MQFETQVRPRIREGMQHFWHFDSNFGGPCVISPRLSEAGDFEQLGWSAMTDNMNRKGHVQNF